MRQSIGSGRVCSLHCWLRLLLANLAFILSGDENRDTRNGNCYRPLKKKSVWYASWISENDIALYLPLAAFIKRLVSL